MVRSLVNIRKLLLHISKTHVGLTSNACLFKFSPVDNETIIELLIEEYKFDAIDANSSGVLAVHFDKLNEYYNKGYFIFQNIDGNRCYAVNNLSVIKEKKLDVTNSLPVYLVRNKDLVKIIDRDFALQNTNHAINHLRKISPNASAKTINYPQMLCGSALIFFSTLFLFLNTFSVINNFAYLLQNILKSILFKRGIVDIEESPLLPINNNMPIYSILIPLYQEEFKVDSILKAMSNMNYPKDKLDIKIIIESNDILTMRALSIIDLPQYIHVIKVPYSFPRTKPKAMNYAMPYVKGKVLTIYDAEDIPDPDQLLKALHAFNTLPENYVCVQAKLNFYNAKENILTRFFSMEYSVWFEYLLYGLSLLDLPVTLGGTSNHFKVDKLKEVGYWDAYNVTEDADLGIRLYLNGYKVHLINSTTIEEAPTDVSTWMAQRTRWIKGFIQTIYVFIKAEKDLSKISVLKILSVYIFVGLSTYSFFCLPWLLLVLMFNIYHPIYYMWLVNSIFSFSYIYAIGYFVLAKNKTTFQHLSWIEWITLFCWPLYFVLHTIASYRAIWETLVSPFKWNKTPHGKSIDDID
tara:strand:+ start:2383 stop:4113 length:1731 start_codon:yes stop_codon:yes gene_type:complete